MEGAIRSDRGIHIPYEMGSQLELLRVSHPSNGDVNWFIVIQLMGKHIASMGVSWVIGVLPVIIHL